MKFDIQNSPKKRSGLKSAAIRIFFMTALVFTVCGIQPVVASDVKVGIYQNEPVIFKDKDDRIKGIYADVLAYVAQKEKWNLKYMWIISSIFIQSL